MNIYEFISLLMLIPFIIFLGIKLDKFWYKSSVSPNLRNLYLAKLQYEGKGQKLDSTIIYTVLGSDLYYYYIYKDKDLVKFINIVLVKVGREKI